MAIETQTTVEDLKAHLEALGIKSTVSTAGNLVIPGLDCAALLAHLTDADFVEREPVIKHNPPVPVHRVDNPIGALHEWCQRRGPDAKPPQWEFSENIGTIHAPKFRCVVRCAGQVAEHEDSSKSGAKRAAAQKMLTMLAALYGAERS